MSGRWLPVEQGAIEPFWFLIMLGVIVWLIIKP
jgi:hypothetical protein